MLENIFPIDELRSVARAKARSYAFKSVHPKLVEEEIRRGWEIQKKNKTSVRLRRAKPHGVQLEDRVWTLLYRMEFAFLSGAGGAKLLLDLICRRGRRLKSMLLGLRTSLHWRSSVSHKRNSESVHNFRRS